MMIKRKEKYYVYDEDGWILIITRSKLIAQNFIKNR